MKRQIFNTLVAAASLAAGGAHAAAPSLSTIYDFQGGVDGCGPKAALVADKAGNLFGITTDGGVADKFCQGGSCGTVFELSPPAPGQTAWTKTVLYNFPGHDQPGGAIPMAGLIIDKSGNLYGTTASGGTRFGPCGTVFSLTPPASGQLTWLHTVLYTFPTAQSIYGQACAPAGRLLLDRKGNFFGTTRSGGGDSNPGTVFKLIKPTSVGAPWTEQVIAGFGSFIGQQPQDGVVTDASGNLYGTATNVAYELSPPPKASEPWMFSELFYFNGGNGVGGVTYGELWRDAAGILYGTTMDGGATGAHSGTVFSLSPPPPGQFFWTETTLHSFVLGNSGAYPMAGLIADKFGKLYGTTAGYSTGTHPVLGASVFELVPPAPGDTVWDWKKLATFDGTNGAAPMGGLIIAPNGKLYGTTTTGGAYGYGTVFELTR